MFFVRKSKYKELQDDYEDLWMDYVSADTRAFDEAAKVLNLKQRIERIIKIEKSYNKPHKRTVENLEALIK